MSIPSDPDLSRRGLVQGGALGAFDGLIASLVLAFFFPDMFSINVLLVVLNSAFFTGLFFGGLAGLWVTLKRLPVTYLQRLLIGSQVGFLVLLMLAVALQFSR